MERDREDLDREADPQASPEKESVPADGPGGDEGGKGATSQDEPTD